MARSFNELKEKMSPERRERVEEQAQALLRRLKLVAEFPEGEVVIDQFEGVSNINP